jgi:hypothetical protein
VQRLNRLRTGSRGEASEYVDHLLLCPQAPCECGGHWAQHWSERSTIGPKGRRFPRQQHTILRGACRTTPMYECICYCISCFAAIKHVDACIGGRTQFVRSALEAVKRVSCRGYADLLARASQRRSQARERGSYFRPNVHTARNGSQSMSVGGSDARELHSWNTQPAMRPRTGDHHVGGPI